MDYLVVAKAMLVNPAGEVLVLQRSLDDENRPGESDLPGGGVEPGETYVGATAREVYEETGIQIPESDLELVYAYTEASPGTAKIMTRFLYLGRVATSDFVLGGEHSRGAWRTPGDLPELFADISWGRPIGFVLEHGLLQ